VNDEELDNDDNFGLVMAVAVVAVLVAAVLFFLGALVSVIFILPFGPSILIVAGTLGVFAMFGVIVSGSADTNNNPINQKDETP
jgi:hypothetical protein